jgi:hypothetical protein
VTRRASPSRRSICDGSPDRPGRAHRPGRGPEPEPDQGRHSPACLVGGEIHDEVDVGRQPGKSVEHRGEPANDDVADVVLVQRGEYRLEEGHGLSIARSGARGALLASPPPMPATPSQPSASEATTGAEPLTAGSRSREVELKYRGISVRYLDRLLSGLLLATSPCVTLASLVRRTYGWDVLACAGCGGRLRLRSVVTGAGRLHTSISARLRDTARGVLAAGLRPSWMDYGPPPAHASTVSGARTPLGGCRVQAMQPRFEATPSEAPE